MLYEYTDDGRRNYSDFGKKVKRDLFDASINDIVETYEEIQTADGLKALVDDGDIQSLVPHTKAHSCSELSSYLQDLIKDYDLSHVALYQKVFRGTSYDYDPRLKRYFDVVTPLFKDGKLQKDKMHDVAYAFYNNRVKLSVKWNEKEEEPQTHRSDVMRRKDSTLFNKMDEFREMEEYLTIIEKIRSASQSRRSEFQDKKQKIVKKLKDLHTPR